MASYGPHLTIDASGCSKEKLSSTDTVYDVLNRLPVEIGMTKLMPPFVIRYTDSPIREDWGVTGFVVIAESHISIHTYPEKDYVFIDVFSCREFDTDKAVEFLKRAFSAEQVNVNIVRRGTDFPRSERGSSKAAFSAG